MSRRGLIVAVVGTLGVSPALGDEVLYNYEGDVVPYDESAGWIIANECEEPCNESVENGHFVLYWPEAGDLANYHYWIAQEPAEPPPTLWVEWRFRSNHPKGPIFYTCDAKFMMHYGGMSDLVWMYGDAAISNSGSGFVAGLDIEEFHTYRYESLDGINYRIAVDGLVFMDDATDMPDGYHYLQFSGMGGCASDQIPDAMNEWDYIRYGTIETDDPVMYIDSTDPPGGYLDPDLYPELDRFSVTFQSPGFVFIDEITVEVTGGIAPEVIRVWRRENDGPNTVEIVLDRPIPLGEETRFTFGEARDDEPGPNELYYTYVPQEGIPTVSTWGMVVMALLILVGGTFVFRRGV